ncbi:polysaccharide chain length determinant protein, PEP-CTERM locus subfamily [Ectothiorhodospira mobilis]|uniref:Polysaccharide chain length determinant protein, PEP-CTERM locus subfamily n=1 Tax=Ectothiorhodospira mobilis TaxID=195064 RepID=A0A1I4P8W0_ECTMO|nr:XrtA system polysaccharide chain length determinant [Ectothiorhodospira mobilis]SFM24016.1 polysaccharide chain length determinant protein, PEP-CTERM locus subfamily [Ectothiorhodospira mobilis]
MQDILNQILGYVRDTWRYRWIILLIAWVVSLVGWAYATRLPDVYEASARVHVDTDSMLRPLLRGLAVDSNPGQRVAFMTRTMLTTPNLESVARATDLHLQARSDADMQRIVEQLRSSIRISAGGRNDNNIYSISYTHADPQRAYDVVQALLNRFVEGALGEFRSGTDQAQRFLEAQIQAYEQRLRAAEERLAEFRRENAGMLPDDRGDYYARLQAARNALEETRLKIREAVNRRDEIRRQLVGEAPTFGIMGGGGISATAAIDARIRNLQERLDELLLTYTERHPDIQSIQRTIEDLEAQREETLRLARQSGPTAEQLNANPVYQQMRMSLSSVEVELASLRARERQQQAEVEELQRLVDVIPEIEAQLKRLNRDYEVNREQYQQLLRRREIANVSERLEEQGNQVQFRVIEPARVPSTPSAPNRPALFTLSSLGGIALGAGLAFLIGQLRPVFHNRRSLNSVTGFPVLGTVSRVTGPQVRMRERVELGAFTVGGLLLLGAYLAVLAAGGIHWSIAERLLG